MKSLKRRIFNFSTRVVYQQAESAEPRLSQIEDAAELDQETVQALHALKEELVGVNGLMGWISPDAWIKFKEAPLGDLFNEGGYYQENNSHVPANESDDIDAYFDTPDGRQLRALIETYMADFADKSIEDILQLSAEERVEADYLSEADIAFVDHFSRIHWQFPGMRYEYQTEANQVVLNFPESFTGVEPIVVLREETDIQEFFNQITDAYKAVIAAQLTESNLGEPTLTINNGRLTLVYEIADQTFSREIPLDQVFDRGGEYQPWAFRDLQYQLNYFRFEQEVRLHCQGLADEIEAVSGSERTRNAEIYRQARRTLTADAVGIMSQDFTLPDGRVVNTGVFNTESAMHGYHEEGGLRTVLSALGFNSYAGFAAAYNARFPHRRIASQDQIVENACSVDERRRQDIRIGDDNFKNVRFAVQIWIAANQIENPN